jgi:hypothetical protein
MSQNEIKTEPPTPVEVLKLAGYILNLKRHAIACLLECSGDRADEICLQADEDNLVLYLYALQVVGDKCLITGVLNMRRGL